MDVVTITNYVIYYAKKLNNLEMEKHVMYKIEFWYRFILQYDFFYCQWSLSEVRLCIN